ncbi:ATP-binding protein, partial [Vibrio parahaemolyticus]
MTREKIEILDNAIERRADYIKSEDLIDNTSINDFFSDVIKSLTNRQTTLIVGPRGCGKTHMMRYTALACNSDEKKPLAIYVTFNRYYRLEPMLTSDIDAINTFHTWALTQIVLAAYEALDTLSNSEKPNLDELSSFFSIETLYN